MNHVIVGIVTAACFSCRPLNVAVLFYFVTSLQTASNSVLCISLRVFFMRMFSICLINVKF